MHALSAPNEPLVVVRERVVIVNHERRHGTRSGVLYLRTPLNFVAIVYILENYNSIAEMHIFLWRGLYQLDLIK